MEVEINQYDSLENQNSFLCNFSDTNLLTAAATPPQSSIHFPENHNISPTACSNSSIESIVQQLANNVNVLCKSQQRDEEDISKEEKVKIMLDIFHKSKSNFLSRFGPFLSSDQANFFEQFQSDPKDGYEVMHHLTHISQMASKKKRHRYLRNKRYAALKRLEKESYFSETEMMKRNPLLYEQLVGQYLTSKEKRIRDYQTSGTKTFVGVLMEGIEKEQTEEKRKKQEEAEDAVMKEEEYSESDSSSDEDFEEAQLLTSKRKQLKKPPQMLWGEFQEAPKKVQPEPKTSAGLISAQERKILKEEFVSIMYESFLNGEDDEFDYNTVDNNDEYDNIDIVEHDEEEKYFDSEEPEDMTMKDGADVKAKEESSEDELDMYMNALNQHPAVCQLSEHIKKL